MWMREIRLPGQGLRLKELWLPLPCSELRICIFGYRHAHSVTCGTKEIVTVPKVFEMECHPPVKLGIVPCEIWGSCSGVTDDSSHLVCDTVSFGKQFSPFWRIADPSHILEPLAQWYHWRRLQLSSFVPVILCLACRWNDKILKWQEEVSWMHQLEARWMSGHQSICLRIRLWNFFYVAFSFLWCNRPSEG